MQMRVRAPINILCGTRWIFPTLPIPHLHPSKMFARQAVRSSLRAAQASAPSSRFFSNSAVHNKNVAVLGASGGIGQPVREREQLKKKEDQVMTG